MCKGNGKSLGIGSLPSYDKMGLRSSGSATYNYLQTSKDAYNTSIGTSTTDTGYYGTSHMSLGIVTEATGSGIIVERNNSKYLCFYIN